MRVEFEFCSKLRPVIQNSWWQSEWDFFSFDGQRKNFDLLLIDKNILLLQIWQICRSINMVWQAPSFRAAPKR